MNAQQAGSPSLTSRPGAWRKAVPASLCAAALIAFAAGAAAQTPIKLAIFDFELEDSSAAVVPAGTASADTMHLTKVTDEIRQLFAQSARYHLVDVAGADAAAAKTHALRDCDGCEAAIAMKLGAEQSFVGVVRRVSRTEYTVRFQIRDARTGAVVSDGDSGLRMGADYSWSRGAVRLVKDRLLEGEAQQ